MHVKPCGLPDSLNTLRAIRAGNYIIATGLYTQGRYLLYDLDTKTFGFHLSYPEHPVYPALREDTKAILYASTVLKVRPDNRYFVCGDMYSGNLEFCRITGDHIDRIKAYCYHHPRVYITEKTVPDVAYSRDNRFGFTDITVTSEKVYAIYSGHTYRENPRTFQQCRQLPRSAKISAPVPYSLKSALNPSARFASTVSIPPSCR